MFQHDNVPIATGFAQFSNCCNSVKFALLQQVFERFPLLVCVEFNHETILTTPSYIFWLVILSFFSAYLLAGHFLILQVLRLLSSRSEPTKVNLLFCYVPAVTFLSWLIYFYLRTNRF